jgi:3',5'-cyclic AMP phosphodiesterase CpdA
MKKQLVISLFGPLMLAALASIPSSAGDGPNFVLDRGDVNPWLNLDTPTETESFQFAIVGDRVGGAREGVFERAVDRLNLLRPDFIMTVGDLVEGRMPDEQFAGPEVLESRWSYMVSLLQTLQAPVFLVPGNNELATPVGAVLWASKFGRTYYEFRYRDVLFVVLNSEDPPRTQNGHLGNEQLVWLERTLADNGDARWTLVFVHRPMWLYPEHASWTTVQGLLKGRKHTVFAGHHHRYSRTEHDGSVYYGFSVTGGSHPPLSSDRDSFDHLMWVTMAEHGPVVANLPLDGIWGDDPVSDGESER